MVCCISEYRKRCINADLGFVQCYRGAPLSGEYRQSMLYRCHIIQNNHVDQQTSVNEGLDCDNEWEKSANEG